MCSIAILYLCNVHNVVSVTIHCTSPVYKALFEAFYTYKVFSSQLSSFCIPIPISNQECLQEGLIILPQGQVTVFFFFFHTRRR